MFSHWSLKKLMFNIHAGFFATKNMAYIGLGSNLGNKFANIFKACNLISNFSTIKKSSQLYYSPCINLENKIEKDENYFINSVVKIETNLDYKQLLLACKGVEKVLNYFLINNFLTGISKAEEVDTS